MSQRKHTVVTLRLPRPPKGAQHQAVIERSGVVVIERLRYDRSRAIKEQVKVADTGIVAKRRSAYTLEGNAKVVRTYEVPRRRGDDWYGQMADVLEFDDTVARLAKELSGRRAPGRCAWVDAQRVKLPSGNAVELEALACRWRKDNLVLAGHRRGRDGRWSELIAVFGDHELDALEVIEANDDAGVGLDDIRAVVVALAKAAGARIERVDAGSLELTLTKQPAGARAQTLAQAVAELRGGLDEQQAVAAITGPRRLSLAWARA